ncbi:Pol polyprotein [Dictyocoela muelleri]|nr:Pol polyprotein [Dictyocoela muelleri]
MGRIYTIKTPEELMLIYNNLHHGFIPDFDKPFQRRDFLDKCSRFKYISNFLYINHNEVLKKYLCVFKNNEKNYIIRERHLLRHIGMNKLKNIIDDEFVGITSKDISNFIKSCKVCNEKTRPEQSRKINSIVIEDVHQRLMCDLMDFSIYSSNNFGYKYAFSLIDCFSKFAFVFPIKEKNGMTIVKILEDIFYTEGPWSNLHTDNGREFCNKEVEILCERFGINIIHGRPRHPQSQGQIERFNRTFKERLRMSMGKDSVDWISKYKEVLYQYNNTIHRSTKKKPFNVFRGIDIINKEVQPIVSDNYSVQNEARDNLKKYASKYDNIESENDFDEINLNEKVILMKDFDNNTNTRRNPFDSLYHEEIFTVIKVNKNVLTISDQNGNHRCVVNSRVKKITNSS